MKQITCFPFPSEQLAWIWEYVWRNTVHNQNGKMVTGMMVVMHMIIYDNDNDIDDDDEENMNKWAHGVAPDDNDDDDDDDKRWKTELTV